MFVTSPSLFHSRHFERPLSKGFGLNYIALGIHFRTHLEKNSVRFEESVLDRTLGPFWNCFWCSRPPQKEPFWKPFRLMLPSRGALRLKIEDFGGVWLQSLFLKRFYVIFGGVLDSENVDFAWEGSQKSQFHRSQNSTTFWLHFGNHFGTKISLKWRLASPCAALGSHLDRFLGVRQFVLKQFYGTGR